MKPPLNLLWTLVVCLAIPHAARGEEKKPQALALKLEPLLVSLRAAEGSQLIRAQLEGAVPPGPWAAHMEIAGRPAIDVACGQLDPKEPSFTLALPKIEKETEVTVTLSSGDAKLSGKLALKPLKPWKLFLVQHSHTDMGYTEYPSRLAIEHMDFIDEALRACDLTDGYPEAARFRWTCEGTWAVERYLEQRPKESVARFLGRVAQGRVDVAAISMNMTDLATEEVCVRSFYPVARLRSRGIPIRSAMQCDVNGFPWALPEFLSGIGVTGFAAGINLTRSTLPFEFPQAITWESPSGDGVLMMRAEHYMIGNFLGFDTSAEKVLAELPRYLRQLEEKRYPYASALIQVSGYFTDNSAPCHRLSDVVREWNEKYAVPEARVATMTEWFDALRKEKDLSAPASRKAWPDWWADGVGSSALETAVVRQAQEKLSFGETLLALGRLERADLPDWQKTLREAYLLACLYDEHTWGAAESIEKPFSVNTKTQWGEKAANAWRASWHATEIESAALDAWGAHVVPHGKLAVAVFNSLSWERTGPVLVRVSRGLVEAGTPFRLEDPETGAEIPYQFARESRNYREIEFVASGVPAFGYRIYRIDVQKGPAATGDPFLVKESSLSNGLVVVEIDPARAAISTLRPQAGGENVIDLTGPHGFNQYVHERILDPKKHWYLWPAPAKLDPAAFERKTPGPASVSAGAAGPVRRSLKLSSKLTVPQGEVAIETEISVYRGLPGVYVENRVRKPEVLDPEASYFAFPFASGAPLRTDLVGGVMVPGTDQVPGSATDWHAIQRWVRAAGNDRNAVWVTVDAPLVQFGGLNVGRYGRDLALQKPLVYSWVMNNYWFTNFLASQRGEFVFRYAAACGEAASSDQAADHFAREVCSPLKAAAVEGRGDEREGGPWSRSLLEIEPADVMVVAVKEPEDGAGGLVVRVRNRSGAAAKAAIKPRLARAPRSAARTSIIEEPLGEIPLADGAARLEIKPWGIETVLFRWK